MNAKSTGTTKGNIELSCENKKHHRNGTLHLYSESLFTYFPWYDFPQYKRNIVCMYIFIASRCQIIPFPFVENALNLYKNTSYIYSAK